MELQLIKKIADADSFRYPPLQQILQRLVMKSDQSKLPLSFRNDEPCIFQYGQMLRYPLPGDG